MPQYKSSTPTNDSCYWYFNVQYRDSLNNLKVFTSKKYVIKTETKDEERKYLNHVKDKNKAPIAMTIGELWKKF